MVRKSSMKSALQNKEIALALVAFILSPPIFFNGFSITETLAATDPNTMTYFN